MTDPRDPLVQLYQGRWVSSKWRSRGKHLVHYCTEQRDGSYVTICGHIITNPKDVTEFIDPADPGTKICERCKQWLQDVRPSVLKVTG